jgi:hypothetical protein
MKQEITLKFSADDQDLFNSARLLILFDVLEKTGDTVGLNIEKVGYYDFFSAQPFLIFGNEEKKTKIGLILYGFELRTISYMSSSQRFANRREKLKHYLAQLMIRDLVKVRNIDGEIVYSITADGKKIANSFNTQYDYAYRKSAKLIIKKFKGWSNNKIALNAKSWLKAEPFVIDLYDF